MNDRLELARHYLRAGNAERAYATVEGIEDAGAHADAWAIRAAAALASDRPQEAWNASVAGLELEPDSLELLGLKAGAGADLGALKEAESAVLACLSRSPDDPDYLCLYADVVARDGQLDKAGALLDRASRAAPDSLSVLMGRANLAYLRGDKKRLREHASKMLEVDPSSRASHHVGGMAMANSGRFHAAARHYSEAAGLDPTHDGSAEIARESRAATHPLMLPLWPIARFGPWPVWGAGLILLFGSRAVAPEIAGPVALVWIVYVIYSWVVPSIVERLAAR